MNKNALIVPMRFRFTEPADVEAYGDRWFIYDEAALVRLPVRKLIELETELGMPLVDVMGAFRENAVIGDLGAAWIAVHLAAPDVAGPFDAFAPVVMLLDWGKVPAEDVEAGKGEGTPTPLAEGSPTLPLPSDPTDTVVLQTMPPAA